MHKKNSPSNKFFSLALVISICSPGLMCLPCQARGGFSGGGGRGSFGGGGGFRGGASSSGLRSGSSEFRGGTNSSGFRGNSNALRTSSNEFRGNGNTPRNNGVWQRPNAEAGHLPTDGGFASVAGYRNNSVAQAAATHPINHQELNNQANAIRHSYANNPALYNNFNHLSNWNAAGWNHSWWGYPGAWYAPGWAAATAWAGLGFSSLALFEGLAAAGQPVVADYGNTIVYNGDTIYVNNQPYCSAGEYYQQAQQLAGLGISQQPDFIIDPPANEQWKPLGVYSLVQGNQTESTMLLQLAINQNGIVKGNYYNQLTNETSVISGSLDRSTQRIAWIIDNNSSTVFDTTLGNLCNRESPVLVHYSSGNTQQMGLVRLDPPPGVKILPG